MAVPTLILPVGTHIVSRIALGEHPAGAVGVIVRSPEDGSHRYRVRLPDGAEYALYRHDLLLQKQERLGPLADPEALADAGLQRYIILRVVVGSRAFGLADERSDWDRRGVYLPPASLHWSLYGVPEQLEEANSDTYWEYQKFVVMALKANPNILETLASPLVEHITPHGVELRAHANIFLSKLVYTTYNGYVLSQFKKMEADLRNQGAVKMKHAMHLIRMLYAGITMLREGRMPVDAGEQRDLLLAIKRGEMPWEEIDRTRLSLHRDFDRAYEATRLPERPDYAAANALLLNARRAMVDV